MKAISNACAVTALAVGMTVSAPSQAVTQSQVARLQAGPACQLSIPTTDTKTRPKATAFRNEGTTNAFVICEFGSPTGEMTKAEMYVTSIDGVPRNVTCTGVNGFNIAPSVSEIAYSAKTVSTDAVEGVLADFLWDASDFGGTAGSNLPNSGFFSVTCNLPPQTAINVYGMYFNQEIGA
ncbi:MAG TPA: hypothetical protein VFI26_09615 [Lysobacter sp.]|jgi:hypothetical protein|nr:hypothetical protein [Lysobacter sp.]